VVDLVAEAAAVGLGGVEVASEEAAVGALVWIRLLRTRKSLLINDSILQG